MTTDKYKINRLHYNYAVAEVTSGQPGHVAGGGGGVSVLGRGAPHADAVVIRGRDQDLKISSSHKRSLNCTHHLF